jgi:hypothetical protein
MSKPRGPVVPPQPPRTRVACRFGHVIRTRATGHATGLFALRLSVYRSPRGHTGGVASVVTQLGEHLRGVPRREASGIPNDY